MYSCQRSRPLVPIDLAAPIAARDLITAVRALRLRCAEQLARKGEERARITDEHAPDGHCGGRHGRPAAAGRRARLRHHRLRPRGAVAAPVPGHHASRRLLAVSREQRLELESELVDLNAVVEGLRAPHRATTFTAFSYSVSRTMPELSMSSRTRLPLR